MNFDDGGFNWKNLDEYIDFFKKIDNLKPKDPSENEEKKQKIFDEIEDTVSALESIIEDKLALEVISKLKSQILKLKETET